MASSSSSIGVHVIWSIFHHDITQREDVMSLRSKIQQALRKANPNFVISDKILIVGTNDVGSWPAFDQRPEIFELHLLPMTPCRKIPLTERRIREDFEEKLKRAKINEFIRKTMSEKFESSDDHLLVIGGDVQDLDPNQTWRNKGKTLLLVGQETNPYAMQFAQLIATEVWTWEEMKKGGRSKN